MKISMKAMPALFLCKMYKNFKYNLLKNTVIYITYLHNHSTVIYCD